MGFELAAKRSSSSSNVITFHGPGVGTETSAHADSAVRQMPLHEGRWQKKNHKEVPQKSLYTDYDGPLWRRGPKACTLRLRCTFCRWCMNAPGRRGVGHTLVLLNHAQYNAAQEYVYYQTKARMRFRASIPQVLQDLCTAVLFHPLHLLQLPP